MIIHAHYCCNPHLMFYVAIHNPIFQAMCWYELGGRSTNFLSKHMWMIRDGYERRNTRHHAVYGMQG